MFPAECIYTDYALMRQPLLKRLIWFCRLPFFFRPLSRLLICDGHGVRVGTERRLLIAGQAAHIIAVLRSVFRCLIDEMTASELLSLGGVGITAPDLEHGGAERTVTAYYTDYLTNR